MAGKKKWSFTEFEDPALSEAVKELQINRTMYVGQFSKDDDFENELIEVGNTSELFEKIPAKAEVEIETLEGDMDDQELHFEGISEFKRDNLILKVDALQEQSETADVLEHFLKLFGKGKKWQEVFEDPAAKAAFMQRLDAVASLLEES